MEEFMPQIIVDLLVMGLITLLIVRHCDRSPRRRADELEDATKHWKKCMEWDRKQMSYRSKRGRWNGVK
jgi:hypothetical protein